MLGSHIIMNLQETTRLINDLHLKRTAKQFSEFKLDKADDTYLPRAFIALYSIYKFFFFKFISFILKNIKGLVEVIIKNIINENCNIFPVESPQNARYDPSTFSWEQIRNTSEDWKPFYFLTLEKSSSHIGSL